ncbi:MAG: hypothetical protein [Wendovervirus sonii]|uniref:Uncharacterized protein n=1 Tax=phage Lak_Megaphage_Sonny TaxID=3109229 RepID=A0ABZ0Z2D6_9CAUD|nr:MAG: hypothetical protein [phage Lak_Megaphage_Sonny]
MDCTTCTLFKETFGKNIRVKNPIIDCQEIKNDNCIINKILQEASYNTNILADLIPYDDPEYAKKLENMSIQCALDTFDEDSFVSQIAKMHDEQINDL